MNFEEKTVKQQLIYDGKVVKLYVDEVKLSDGSHSKREYVKHSGGVGVLARLGDELIFVCQYRYAYRESVLEIPAGKLERGEQPELCGRRELLEETGYTAAEFLPLGIIYPSVGYTDEKIYIFFANKLQQGEMHLDEGEFLSVQKIKIIDALKGIEDGSILDAKTVIAILKADRMGLLK